MTRTHSPDGDSSDDQSDNYSKRFETITAKAREALKHDDPGAECTVMVRVHNRDRDADGAVTNHLLRTSEEWIAVRTPPGADGGTEVTVLDHGGSLEIAVVELDRDRVADLITRQALKAIDRHESVGHPVEPFTTLVRHNTDVADDLVTEWEIETDHFVRKRLHKGHAGWTGRVAWTAFEDEAIYAEAKRAAARFIDERVISAVSDDVETTIQGICADALFDAVTEQSGCETPNMDYAAEVTLTE